MIACIQLLPEMGDMIPLVILILWPHISLHFIIFKVLSHIPSHLVAADGEFLMVRSRA